MSRSSSQKNDLDHDQARPVRDSGIMLSDLFEELIWPRVLRAPALALAPNRLLSGCVGVFLVTLIVRLYQSLRSSGGQEGAQTTLSDSPAADLMHHALDAVVDLDPIGLSLVVVDASTMLRDFVMHNPLISILLGIPIVGIIALVGGTISRSAGFEFALGRFATREETLHFTLRRTRQFVGAAILPVAFCTIIFMLIALGGLLLSMPVLDVVGSLLYGLGLTLGIVATLVLVLHVIAAPLLVPAMAIEGTDAFDAIQRSYAYVIGRPLRYLLYVAVLTLLGTFAAVLFAMIARLSIDMTDWAVNFLDFDATDRALRGEGEMGATKQLAHRFIVFWRSIVELVIAGYIVSLFFTSSTLLYLAVRRICDGQGINEIWEPVGRD